MQSNQVRSDPAVQYHPRPLSDSEESTINEALAIMERKLSLPGDESFTSPTMTKEFLTLKLAGYQREVFAVMFMDNRHRLLSFEELFFGTIDGAQVHPREVVRRALQLNAAAVILAHNHPSGVTEPSRADESITQRIKEALSLMEVRLLDHMIVGGPQVTSFAERGML